MATEQPNQEKPISGLIADITADLSTLVRKELQLAKIETREEVSRAAKAGGTLGAGGIAGWMALLFVSLAIALALSYVMPAALAFFLVGAIYAVVAAVLITRGRQQLKTINPVPEQTVETLKEDVQWAKAQRK